MDNNIIKLIHDIKTPINTLKLSNDILFSKIIYYFIEISKYKDISKYINKFIELDINDYLIDFKKEEMLKEKYNNIYDNTEIVKYLLEFDSYNFSDSELEHFKSIDGYNELLDIHNIYIIIKKLKIMSLSIDNIEEIITESNKDSKSKFLLVNSIKKSINMVESSFNNKKIEINIKSKINPIIKGNENDLNRVWNNILTNAINSFNNLEGMINIKIHKKNKYIIIDFENNGKKINKKNMKHIFDEGFSTKSKEDNKGLGLFISKQIINNHNGMIFVKSNKLKTTFKIKIPAM